MRAVDTNVLLRLITLDDEKQVAQAREFTSAGAWVSHLVLVETLWVLGSAYHLLPRELATILDMLLVHDTIVLQDADVVAAALGRFRQKPTIGFSDCMVLEIARKAGHLPIGTFDRSLYKLEGVEGL